jgi:sodium/proline symporter
MELQMIFAFLTYFCILMAIGLYVYSKNKTASAYLVGDRSVNYWITAIATQATDMGIWLFMGFPAAVYIHGMPEAWTAIGLVVGMFLNWHFVAYRLRTATERHNKFTLFSFLESHYQDNSGVIRLLTSIFTLIFFTVYISSALMGMGKLFEFAFGLNYHIGIFLGLSAALIYTLLGGFIAVAWCDLFQGIFLLVAIVLVPTYAFFYVDGLHAITTAATVNNVPLSLFSSWSTFLQGILLAGSWGLGYFGQPHILLNFMGIDDPENIRHAKYIGIAWQIIVLCASISIGLIGIAYFANGATTADPQALFVLMTKQFFFPLFAGFVLCGMFAATLSTLDSHILISGSIIAQDIYKHTFNPTAHPNSIVLLSRISSLIISLIAVVLVYNVPTGSIYLWVNYAWTGLGSTLGPVILVTLYSTICTRHGAIAGIIAGGVTSAIWPLFDQSILPMIPSFAAGLIAIYTVSALTRSKAPSI